MIQQYIVLKTTLQRNIENDMTSRLVKCKQIVIEYPKKLFSNIFSPKNMDNAIKLGNQHILQVRHTKFLGIYIDDGVVRPHQSYHKENSKWSILYLYHGLLVFVTLSFLVMSMLLDG